MGVQLVFGRGILVVKNDEAVRETLGIDEKKTTWFPQRNFSPELIDNVHAVQPEWLPEFPIWNQLYKHGTAVCRTCSRCVSKR